MKDNPPPPADPKAAPFSAFNALAAKLMQVPKTEIDRREAAYQRQRSKKPRRGPKPS
jgi:hypothetical protein